MYISDFSSVLFFFRPYKLVTGKQGGKGVWTGQHHPNKTALVDDDKGCGGSSLSMDAKMVCGGDYRCDRTDQEFNSVYSEESKDAGCLFNIEQDPTEHVDLASDPAHAKTLAQLVQALQTAQATQYQTDTIPGYDNCTDPVRYVQTHRGFGGPFCYNGSIPV